MFIELRNTKTGQTKWVSSEEAQGMGLQAPEEKSWSQKLQDVPMVGNILGTLTSAGTGYGANIATPELEKQTGAMQEQARQLTKQAQAEQDPLKRKELLDQSRQLSQGAGEKASKYEEKIKSGVGYFADKESPTGVGGNLKAYGAQGLRTGIEAGTILTPLLKGSGTLTGITKAGTALTKNAGGRILGSALEGAAVGGLTGFAEGDDVDMTQRLQSAVETAGEGALIGGIIQTGIEGLGGIKNAIKKLSGKARDKLKTMYSNTLKQNIKDKNFYKQVGGENVLVNDAVKFDIPSTKNGVRKELSKYGSEYNETITRLSSQAEKQGKTVDIAGAFERARKETSSLLGHDATLQDAGESWFNKNAGKYSKQASAKPSSANSLRMKLDKKVGDMVVGDINAASDKARKMFASELRSQFKEIVGPEGKLAIRRYQLLAGLADAMQKEPKFGITEIALAGASPGKGIYNILEMLSGKGIRSPGLRRALAKIGIKNIKTPTGGKDVLSEVGKATGVLPKKDIQKLRSAPPAAIKLILDLLKDETSK